MADDELTGQAGVEADMGYAPMPTNIPEEDQGDLSVSDGTRAYLERGATEEKPIVDRPYVHLQGEHAGEEVPENLTLSAERAAQDLTAIRNHEQAQAEEHLHALEAQAIDYIRDPAALQVQQAQETQRAEAQQPQPETPAEQMPGVDPEIAQALQNPKVRAALEQEVSKVGAAVQQLSDMSASAAYAGLSAMLNQFPELKGLNGEQLGVAVQLIARQNPARAQEINNQISSIKQSYDQAIQAQNVIQQQRAEQFKQHWSEYVASEDAALFKAVPELADPETQRKSAAGMISTLRDAGFADHDLKAALDGKASISLQDHRAQLLILKAAKYDEAMRLRQNPASKGSQTYTSIPNVVRPGVSALNFDNSSMSEAAAKFRNDPSPKNAAAVLAARRAANR